MTHPLNPAMAATEPPPVMEARRWLADATFTQMRPLLNVSQAAPVDPPPLALRQALAEAAVNDPAAHLYGPVLGNPELREEIALQWSAAYGGTIRPDQVAITQGCNQAFTAVMSTLAGAGDEVILLARRVMWAYPAAVALLLGFIAYQLHHWTLEPSPTLLILSAFDAIMIGLVIREYKALRLGQGGMPSQLRP